MKQFICMILAVACIAACNKNEDKNAQVETRSATGITDTEAVCWGKITEQGSSGIKEYGISIDLPAGTVQIPFTTSKADSFGVQLKELTKGYTYSYRAYAIENNSNIRQGNEKSFKTLEPVELRVSVSATDRTAGIEFQNTGQLREWGLYYRAGEEATTGDTKVEAKGNPTVQLTGLLPFTTYHILAYATDNNGLKISIGTSFTTQYGLPQVTKPAMSAITTSGATATFEIVSTGGGTVTQCGIRYSTDGQTWTSKSATVASGAISCSWTGLSPAVKYYIQAYARNSGSNEAYSETAEFTTAGAVPALAKPAVTALKSYKVSMTGGKVTGDGQLPVTEYGFCWSTAAGQAVATGDSYVKITAGSSAAFEYLSYDLLANTKYYVRAYAKNQVGIGYSEEVAVTTPAIVYGSLDDRWNIGTTYKTVQIGNQTWMAEDLRNNTDGSKGFNINEIKNTTVCPANWHVTTQTEWDELIAETGGINIAPKVLNVSNEFYSYGTNSTGLSVIPERIDTSVKHANFFWTSTIFWQGSSNHGFYEIFMYATTSQPIGGIYTASLHTYDVSVIHPVRCIKDNN